MFVPFIQLHFNVWEGGITDHFAVLLDGPASLAIGWKCSQLFYVKPTTGAERWWQGVGMWGASTVPTDSGAEAPLREWALSGDLVVLQNVVFFLF